jgi:hypothetical protein
MHYGMAILLLAGLVAGAAAAEESVPTFPHQFWGGVTIDGSPAPAGTVIVAVIGGTEYSSIETTVAGEYGSSSRYAGDFLVVDATGDLVGEPITFLVDGQTAQETAAFTPSETTRLDLSVVTGVTPTPTSSGGSGGNTGGGGGSSQAPTQTSAQPTPVTSVGRAVLPVSATGEISESVTVTTADGVGSVTFGEGTIALDKNGDPLGEVTVGTADPAGTPPAPSGTTIGFALDCGPGGATFDPPATLTYTLSAEEWAKIADLSTLKVMWYNPESGAWQEVAATVDAATRTVTAQVSHFSLYALTWSSTTTAVQTSAAPGTSVPVGQETGAATPSGEPPHLMFLWAGVVIIVCALIGGLYFLRKNR